MFESFINAFDFNPLEVGNPMTLGMIEENYSSDYVNCYNEYEDDEDDFDIYYDDDADDYVASC